MAACTEKHHANHTHQHGPKCGHTAFAMTAMWIIFTTAISTICTGITWMNMSSRSTAQIP
ncbi:hypothetical protein [Bradyrhizobium sp. URHD0069]|uniref:hypothetical protein n=1 Tax=Bradyrhizobium sp. URHD0069 TaxID=1380355 RepID=UPI001FDAC0E2|nr:hypothetical protein [Bradyrhizobium sp. URHD0069]